MFRRRPQSLSARIGELTELLQRERIESANRFAAIEGRLAALEDELPEIDEARSRHRDDLTQVGQALAAHRRVLDQAVADYSMQPEAPNTSAEIAPARSAAAPR